MNHDSRRDVITSHVLKLIAEASPGALLPSVRALSSTLGASPVTIVGVIADLASRGLLRTEPGRGTFVADSAQRRTHDLSWQPIAMSSARIDESRTSQLDPAASGDRTPLSWGYLGADLQPREALRAAAARTMRRGEAWDSAPANGIPALRALFAAQVGVDPAEILVTQGSQAALASIFRSLANPGDPVIVENPTYPGALAAAQAAGLRAIPVPTDIAGVKPELLDEVLDRSRAKLVYLQATHANPTGASLDQSRRAEVIDIARRRNAFLIDDNWAQNLSLSATPRSPLLADDIDGHVIHITTLSKAIAPSLRVGYIAARGPALQRLLATHLAEELFNNRPLQEIAVEFLSSAEWPRHANRMRRVLVERLSHLRGLLAATWPDGHLVVAPSGGYHLWVPLPPGATSTALTARAHSAGVIIGDGSTYFSEEPPEQRIRLSFGAVTMAEMDAALKKVVALL